MDEFFKQSYISVFKKYVQSYQYEFATKVETLDDGVVFYTQYSTSKITFYDNCIIELQITNNITNEPEFYLHFQMKTFSHSLALFNDMIKTAKNYIHKPKKKVLLSCSSGLTTSMFASSLNDCAKLLHKDYEFEACSIGNIDQKIDSFDIVLLAPQISYQHADIQGRYNNKIVLKIQPDIFAKYDAVKMIEVIDETQLNYEKSYQNDVTFANDIHNDKYHVLSIIIIRNSARIHVGYRLYGPNNKVFIDKEIIKSDLSVHDLFDIIDTVMFSYPNLDVISITTPGIINEGRVSSLSVNGLDKETFNANEVDIKGPIENRYGIKTILINDVNSVALGYHASQKEYKDISVIFQPISTNSGLGHIINNQLHIGYKSLSGEMQYMPLVLSDSRFVLNKTVDGCVELLTQQVLSVITSLAPQQIVICCQLLPSARLIVEELKKYIPEQYIPKIIRITYLQDYAFVGGYISAFNDLRK